MMKAKFAILLAALMIISTLSLTTIFAEDFVSSETGNEVAIGASGEELAEESEQQATSLDEGDFAAMDKLAAESEESAAENTEGSSGENAAPPIAMCLPGTSVKSVCLNVSCATIRVGETFQFVPTINPSNATNKAVSWSVSDSSVARIDGNGLATGLKAGCVMVYVKTADGNKTASAVLTVLANPQTQSVKGVSLNKTTATIQVGELLYLQATISPSTATNKNVTWSSSNTNIATVNSSGKVEGIRAGTASVTVRTADGGYTATCVVTVVEKSVQVTGLTLNPTLLNMKVDDTYTLIATVLPTNATNKTVSWSSSDTSVATVDQTGKVVANGVGTAYIVVSTANAANIGYTATCIVQVTAKTIPVTSVTINPTSATIFVGDTQNFTATVYPTNATNKGVVWSVSNQSIATIDQNGVLTGKAAGYVTVYVTTMDGNKTACASVTVQAAPTKVTSVSLCPTSLSMETGDTYQLTATVLPTNAANKAVTWTSSNTSIVTVSSTGLLTAKAPGNAVVTVTTADGGYTATCQVTVTAKSVRVISMAINPPSATMYVGETMQFTPVFNPTNATNQNVIWSVSYPTVGTIDQNGVLTARAAGCVTVYVVSMDGNHTGYAYVTVLPAPTRVTGVTLNPSTLNMEVGGTYQLNATVYPTNASNRNVTWASSNTSIVTVNSSGNLTAKAVGTATITVTTVDGGFTATCQVTVAAKAVRVTSVSIYPSCATMYEGETLQFTATVNPSNATNKNVTWSVSNTTLATIDQNGLLTAQKAGCVTVYVTTQDGNRTACASVSILPSPNRVKGVSLNKTSLAMEVGDTYQLVATITPSNAANRNVTWTSSNSSIASVSSTGVVTAKAIGSTYITVTTQDGGYTATCLVTVTAKTVRVTGVTLNKTVHSMYVDDILQLVATILPTNATNQAVTWSSSNTTIATVDQNGLVTGKGAGVTYITVRTQDGGFTATCTVTVQSRGVAVTSVSVSPTTKTMEVGDVYQLVATVLPTNATNRNVTWSSSNSSIASVSSTGVVTAKAAGTAYITVTTEDGGFVASCCITVIPKTVRVTGISLNQTALGMEVDDTYQLVATIIPANATNRNGTWTSSNPSIATVAAGVVTARAVGTTTITVTTADGGYTATCVVTVTTKAVRVTGISLNQTTLGMEVDDTYQLVATITPANATNRNVTWTSSNPSIATVAAGVVTARAVGTTTITVTTADGGYTATCLVTVTAKTIRVTGVALNKTSLDLEVDGTYQLVATVLPTNATNRNVTWATSNSSIATVNNGLITAKAVGVAIITVTTQDGNYTATCLVNVGPQTVRTTGVTLDKSTLSMEVDGTYQLVATVLPQNATNRNVTWTTSNGSIATVNNGLVTAKAVGTTTITVTTVDGGYTATCLVTVSAKTVRVTGVTLNKTTLAMEANSTFQLIATVLPANATNQNVSWATNNSSIATVSNGLVTAKAVGSAIITVTTQDGNYSASCLVTVSPQTINVTGVTLDKNNLTMAVDDIYQLIATITPANATNQNVTWYSSNSNIATVSTGGVVTAKGAGTATITVTTQDGGFTASCVVTVTAKTVPITGITMNITSATVRVGEYYQFNATITPANATNQNLLWWTGNSAIATIDQTGKVRGESVGMVVVFAQAQDGSGKYAYALLQVLPSTTAVTGVTLNQNTVNLEVDGTYQLVATVAPANATNQNVTWTTSNSSIATVSNNGLITAKAVGSAIVTVTTADGGYTATCLVTVTAKTVRVTGINLDRSSLTMEVDSYYQLAATVLPQGATNQNVTWTTSNSSIATVGNNGLVNAKAVGTTTITARTADGNYTATCLVTVTAKTVPVVGVTLNKNSHSMVVNDTYQLIATVLPQGATNQNVTWASSAANIATVSSSGLITAKAPGTVNITVTTADGNYTATCYVTVTANNVLITDLSLNIGSKTINIGETYRFIAAITPANATNQTLSWWSSNNSIATVDQNGNATGVSAGTVIIFAQAQDGSGKYAYAFLQVLPNTVPVTGISLNRSTLGLEVDESYQLWATITPSNATNLDVTWSSSNTSIATVARNGIVTGKAVGTAVVTARSTDGNYTATCVVTVTAKAVRVTGVSLPGSTVTIEVGETYQYAATVTPGNATNKNVVWGIMSNSIATISATGLVTGQAEGITTVYVRTVDGNYIAYSTLKVVPKSVEVTKLTIKTDPPNASPKLRGGETVQLTVEFTPSNATNKNVIWSSSDTKIATVSSTGLVRAKQTGMVWITVKTEDGRVTDTFFISVSGNE